MMLLVKKEVVVPGKGWIFFASSSVVMSPPNAVRNQANQKDKMQLTRGHEK